MESWRRLVLREVGRTARVAVVGVGNVDRGDDAAGALVARNLLDGRPPLPEKALAIDAGEIPENFTGVVRAFRPDLVVIVDAARGGRPPGTVFLVAPDEVAEEDLSTHRVPLSRLARYIRETMDCRVLIVGIEPASSEPGAGVAPAVARAARSVTEALRKALAAD